MGNPSISERAFATHTTIQRDMLDTVSSRVSSTVASHRSFASQATSSAKINGHGAETYEPNSSDSVIPPHVIKTAETIQEEWGKRPFVMPDDEEIFRIRGLEKKWKEQKKKERSLPVFQKTTFASRMAGTVASESLKQELAAISAQLAKEMESIKAATILPTEHYHREKENMAEFIAKKREIFLVQMSLDNKRAEIRKLEEGSFQREEALRKSEAMLAEDIAQFEAFLKQNDEKVQEAIKKAEYHTKLKQEKLAEIKRLNVHMATMKKDLNKFQEQLDECKKYKDFILSLTPKEWLDANNRLQNENNQANKEKLVAANATTKEVGEGDMEADAMEKMYFQTPSQLLEIFRGLEEKNLLLMQEHQDMETSLEDLKTKFSETKLTNELKISNLRSQLEAINESIKMEQERENNLQNKPNVNMIDKKHDVSFEEISEKVSEIYRRCGLEDDSSLGTLQRLTSIEVDSTNMR